MRRATIFGGVSVLFLLLTARGDAARAQEPPLRLAAPPALIESGLLKHLLPRFGFKTRLRAQATPLGEAAEFALTAEAEAPVPGGVPVMTSRDGVALTVTSLGPAGAEAADAFVRWLKSASGRRAIESFTVDGEQAYAAGAETIAPQPVEIVRGDADLGARLALVHCGRCHVIDARNRYGGIGSTPSFGALRTIPDWRRRFGAFWTLKPHGSFTQVEGRTGPFDPASPPPIAPLRLTVAEVEAIGAFAASIPPKDLGAPAPAQ